MGNTFRKLFDSLWGSREMRVVMLGKQVEVVKSQVDRRPNVLENDLLRIIWPCCSFN